jgi:hypothetical protein
MVRTRRLLATSLVLAMLPTTGLTADDTEGLPQASPLEPSYPGESTRILSPSDAERLRANHGVTLQWIDWDRRGSVIVDDGGTLWTLRASQSEAGGPGRLFMEGKVLEIGPGYFTFDGVIRISDTPDPGRSCEERKTWHFAITQNRPYYRLREFEWCDDLTDYIDIYFVPVPG